MNGISHSLLGLVQVFFYMVLKNNYVAKRPISLLTVCLAFFEYTTFLLPVWCSFVPFILDPIHSDM